MKFYKVKTMTTMVLASTAILGTSSIVLAGDGGDEYNSNAIVKFKPDTAPTDPTDPENPDTDGNKVNPWDPTTPDHKPKPGTNGPLSIDFASSFDFGLNLITDKDMSYDVEAQYYFDETGERDLTRPKPNYVQITDKRGTNSGWTLTVMQKEQLTSESGKLLDGAIISFESPNVAQNKATTVDSAIAPKAYAFKLAPGKAVKVMDATSGHGMYTWINSWGNTADFVDSLAMDEITKIKRNPAITLSVPGKTIKDAALYKSELIWALNDAPGNSVVNPGE